MLHIRRSFRLSSLSDVNLFLTMLIELNSLITAQSGGRKYNHYGNNCPKIGNLS
jgi:hypothetical protein